VDASKAEELAQKIREDSFTLEDFAEQLRQLRKMGPLDQILDMVPFLKGAKLGRPELDAESQDLKRFEAIIGSMTPGERQTPAIINGERRARIARGSGTSVQDVNRSLSDRIVHLHEPEEPDGIMPTSLANQAAGAFTISRSSRSCFFSRRSRCRSSRSTLVSPSGPMPCSRSAWRTQLRMACAEGSNSRDSSSGFLPERAKSTICLRNSDAYGGRDLGIVDSSRESAQVSSRTGQIGQARHSVTSFGLPTPPRVSASQGSSSGERHRRSSKGRAATRVDQ
jgi:hypothetical protein